MPTLNLQIPDSLHYIFAEENMVTVRTTDKKALIALLWWLWSKGGAWISSNPINIRQAWAEETRKYLNIDHSRIKFLSANDLMLKEFDYAVIEEPEIIPNAVAWARQNVHKGLRLYEASMASSIDNIDSNLSALPIEERKKLLADVRAKRNKEYDEYELISSITSESLYEFMLEFWPNIVPETFVDNWHIRYLCDELQYVAELVFANRPKEYDLIINIAPGSTKSLITSVMLPAWCWTRMPSLRYIGGSYAQTLAMDLSRKNRQIVKSVKYQLCFGIKMRSDQDTKTFFMNEQGGMRLGMGTGGIAGFHAHIIGVDDPLDPNKSVSEIELRAANTWINESLNQRKIDQTITPMILIMQRLHQDDPTGNQIERTEGQGIKHICIPAEITDDVKPVELRKFYVDGLMDPRRLPKKTLLEKRKLGQYLYSGQYLQSPTMPEGGMFKWERIKIGKPKHVKFKKIVRYWDKAATEDDGCYTVGLKMAEDTNGEYWVLHVRRGQWDSARREAIIRQTAELDGKDVIIGVEQEPGSGGKESVEATKRKLEGFTVRADRPTGDKVLRADAFSTAVNDGIVHVIPDTWTHDYIEELSMFPMGKFKDQVDSSSGAYGMLVRPLIKVGGGFKK